MLNRVYNFLSSMKFATLMLLLFAFASGYATFIERDFGTASANAIIYRAWWFELIQILLCVSLVLNMFKFKLFRKEKLATLSFHLSFVLIILGAGITRYVGFEGRMKIETNESKNSFMSDNMFLQIDVHDTVKQLKLDKQLNLSSITRKFDKTPVLNKLFSNYFKVNSNNFLQDFSSKPKFSEDFSIEYVDFLTNIIDSKIGGVILNAKNNTLKSGTQVSLKDMKELKIENNSVKQFKSKKFTVNNQKDSSINFILKSTFPLNSKIGCISDVYDILVQKMPPDPNDIGSFYPCGTFFELDKMSLLTVYNNITDSVGEKFVFTNFYFEDTVMYSSSSNMDMRENDYRTQDALIVDVKVNDKIKRDTLRGSPANRSTPSIFKLGELYFTLSYGPKFYQLPFNIKLDKAETVHYAGSKNPSSYKSHVTVEHSKNVFSDSIYMNNILNYDGYRFYQASIAEDDSFTVLSVNHDWLGTLVSYIGYFFMMLGMIMVFFSQKTRFKNLSKRLNKLKNPVFFILLCFCVHPAQALHNSHQNHSNQLSENEKQLVDSENYDKFLAKYEIDATHAKKFDRLLLQHAGRIKPMSTYSVEVIRKFSRKEKLYDLTPSQTILGIMCFPHIWNHVPIFKVENQQLINDMDSENELVSYNQISKIVTYEEAKKAYATLDIEKSKRDKEILKLWERRYIYEQISLIGDENFSNQLFAIFPVKNDEKWKTLLSYDTIQNRGKIIPLFFPKEKDANSIFLEIQSKPRQIQKVFFDLANKKSSDFLKLYAYQLKMSHKNDDYSFSDNTLKFMIDYQNKTGTNLIPEKWKIDLEILYNKVNIFHQLFKLYFFAGFISLVLVILNMFYIKKWIQKSIFVLKWIIFSGFLLHTLGLISRWIISNHAPWTNGYEAMIYTVWATMLAAIIFSKKSALTLATTTLVSSMLLLFAFISSLDPTITNVVPVLNSYWLMIHVSIIVASYGFLIMGGFLGLLCILLILFKTLKSKNIIDYNISKLTIINEKSLMIGLFMLTIGTFLGGVWANESWGRYWGWDAKETWALVSVLVYAFILHMRFIPSLKSKFSFNVASMFAVFSVLMTYFGVNYLLSGLHSYAAADEKVTIPNYIYITFGSLVLLSVLASIKQRYLDKIEIKISDKK